MNDNIYYLKDNETHGPFTIDELKNHNLDSETYVWFEGMGDWEKLKDIPQLQNRLMIKLSPPPPPNLKEKEVSRTEVIGENKVKAGKQKNQTLENISPNSSTIGYFIAWCGFHLFALLMSYSEVEIFNDSGKPQTDKFWPFVDYTHKVFSDEWNSKVGNQWNFTESEMYDDQFNGIFTDYDWSEFAFYVGGAILIYLLIRTNNKKEA
jgi:hypothetical protein